MKVQIPGVAEMIWDRTFFCFNAVLYLLLNLFWLSNYYSLALLHIP